MAVVDIWVDYPNRSEANPFAPATAGNDSGMQLSLLLILIGIILAVLVNYAIGIVCILIGLFLLIWPRLRTSRTL
jgi:hypothetical protein